jgi:hypothetical protein
VDFEDIALTLSEERAMSSATDAIEGAFTDLLRWNIRVYQRAEERARKLRYRR